MMSPAAAWVPRVRSARTSQQLVPAARQPPQPPCPPDAAHVLAHPAPHPALSCCQPGTAEGLGSVAEHLSRSLKGPLAVVRPGWEAAAAAADGGEAA